MTSDRCTSGVLSERIRALRVELRLSRPEFSKAIGVPLRTIEGIENARRSPGGRVLESIARVWPEYAHWLLAGEEDLTEDDHVTPLDTETKGGDYIGHSKPGQRLRIICQSEGLTLQEFAARMAIPANTLKQIWRRDSEPKADLLSRAAEIWPRYGLWLLTGRTDPPNHVSPETFSVVARIKILLSEKKITRKQLAELTGISAERWASVINNKTHVRLQEVIALGRLWPERQQWIAFGEGCNDIHTGIEANKYPDLEGTGGDKYEIDRVKRRLDVLGASLKEISEDLRKLKAGLLDAHERLTTTPPSEGRDTEDSKRLPTVAFTQGGPVMTRELFAKATGLTVETVRGMVNRGHLPSVRIGRHRLINYKALKDALEGAEGWSPGAAPSARAKP